jgi:hypothetical protein
MVRRDPSGDPLTPRMTPRGEIAPERHSEDICTEDEIPHSQAISGYGHGWFRTSDLSRVKRALSH